MRTSRAWLLFEGLFYERLPSPLLVPLHPPIFLLCVISNVGLFLEVSRSFFLQLLGSVLRFLNSGFPSL